MESFDDPNLKAAICRACGGDAAPASLRAKIQTLPWQGESSPVKSSSPRKSRPAWFARPMWWGVALAASLAIVVGVYFNKSQALPVDVAGSMIKTHDHCCKVANHAFIKGDYAVIGGRLACDLKVPVLSTALAGWTFDGAGECPVWGHPSAHLLYRRGNQVLSIFTLPSADFAMAAGNQTYINSIDGHYLASFTKDNGLYCVLETSTDGSAKASDVSQIRDQLLDTFAGSSIATPPARLAMVTSFHH